MSADNFILITENKEGLYVIAHKSFSGGELWFDGNKEHTTLEKAIKTANDFMKDNVVEYGLDIVI